jgi:MFS family permease
MVEVSTRQNNKKWPQYMTSSLGKCSTFQTKIKNLVVAVVVMFTSGIHYGWPSPFLPKLLSEDHPLNMNSEEASYITTSASVGDIVGSIVCTTLADTIGRKTTLLLIALPQIASNIILYFSASSSLALLYVARFLGGVSEGACLCILPIYLGEISEARIRGNLLSFFSIAWYSGSLFVNTVGSYLTIEVTSLITLSFPVFFLVTFFFMPKSPYYLLIKDQIEEARLALVRLRANNNVDEELSELKKDVERQMSERGKYQDLILIKSNRSAILMMMGLSIVCEFSGITSLTFYAQLFFMEATDVLPEEWAANLMIVLQLVFTLVSSAILDYVGRKPLLLFSIGGCCASLTFLTVYFMLNDYSSVQVSDLNWIPLMGMMLFQIFFNVGLGNVVNCLTGELFSASIKTKATCVTTTIYAICVSVDTKIYQVLTDTYSLGVPLLVFATVQLVGFIFCWKLVPETKGMTLEEIQQEIKTRRNILESKNTIKK